MKDLGWCQLMELYLVEDIYSPERLKFSTTTIQVIVHNNLQQGMIKTKQEHPHLNEYGLLQILFANVLKVYHSIMK